MLSSKRCLDYLSPTEIEDRSVYRVKKLKKVS